jgi:hypothetical protein
MVVRFDYSRFDVSQYNLNNIIYAINYYIFIVDIEPFIEYRRNYPSTLHGL